MSQSRTPSKLRISGQVSSSGTITSENHLLLDELAGRLSEVAFADFFHAFLLREQDDPQTVTKVDSAALDIQQSHNFRAAFGRFSSSLSASESAHTYRPLVDLMNLACSKPTSDTPTLTFSYSTSTVSLGGSSSRRKPDIVGIPSTLTPHGSSSSDPNWKNVAVVCEYKVTDTPRPRSSTPAAWHSSRSRSESRHESCPPASTPHTSHRKPRGPDMQLARYMLEMRAAQPTREFGFGIQFAKDHVSFWRSDADSTITSEPVPVDSKEFVAAIMFLAHATPVELGYSPEFRNTAGDTATQAENAELTLGDIRYTITDVIYHARALHGRCTRVFGAKDVAGKKYAIKLSWQVTTRISEAELVDHARERGVKNIVELLYWEDLRKLSDGRRSRLPPNTCRGVCVEDRCLRILVLPRYIPLYRVLNPKDFLQASISLLNGKSLLYLIVTLLLSCVEIAIHDLYYTGNILHRDVSVNNLMVREENQSEGVLIDLDLGHEENPNGVNEQEQTSLHRTGTLPFMALDLLQNVKNHPHYHRHDLESFVYVLAWIAGRYENGVESNREMFRQWCEGNWASICDNKESFLSNGRSYRDFQPQPSYDFLDSPLAILRRTLYEAQYNAPRIPFPAPTDIPPASKHEDEEQGEQYVHAPLRTKRKRQIEILPRDLAAINRDSFCVVLRSALINL
jgi:hypothetical protein